MPPVGISARTAATGAFTGIRRTISLDGLRSRYVPPVRKSRAKNVSRTYVRYETNCILHQFFENRTSKRTKIAVFSAACEDLQGEWPLASVSYLPLTFSEPVFPSNDSPAWGIEMSSTAGPFVA